MSHNQYLLLQRPGPHWWSPARLAILDFSLAHTSPAPTPHHRQAGPPPLTLPRLRMADRVGTLNPRPHRRHSSKFEGPSSTEFRTLIPFVKEICGVIALLASLLVVEHRTFPSQKRRCVKRIPTRMCRHRPGGEAFITDRYLTFCAGTTRKIRRDQRCDPCLGPRSG